MQFARNVCVDLHRSLSREWLLVDGAGGCAAQTMVGCATTRFHGLLVAPLAGGTRRHVFLSRFEETLIQDGKPLPISAALFAGGHVGPTGHQYLEEFTPDPHPTSRYRLGQVVVTREVRLVKGRHAVLVRYSMEGAERPLELRLRPFLPCRDAESLTYRNDVLDGHAQPIDSGIRAQPYDALPPVAITVDGAPVSFEAAPQWYERFEYQDDIRNGYEGHEDQFTTGDLVVQLAPGAPVVVAASIDGEVTDGTALWARETDNAAVPGATVRERLERSAEDFLYLDEDGRPGVIAGWPWFVEWGRDTFISLPGLLLARGRIEQCGEYLSRARGFLHDGRLPNVYGGTPDVSHYRAVDPALWYARAIRLYEQAGGSKERITDDLLPALREIVAAYRASDDEVIACDGAGLIRNGNADFAFTWMDSLPAPGKARYGYCVEVNALWYEAIDFLGKLERRAGNHGAHRELTGFRRSVGEAFVSRFWLPGGGYLADTWDHGEPDRSVRPNMVIAAALEASPLDRSQRASVVDVARSELLTPRGLRTLSPREPGYRGRYAGPVEVRDAAYHQGTVWPWLLGFYVEATLRGRGRTPAVKRDLRRLLEGFDDHLRERCLGQVSEVFGGDPPHRPGGTVAQAWSVGELLRAYALLEGPRR